MKEGQKARRTMDSRKQKVLAVFISCHFRRKRRATIRYLHPLKATGKWPSLYTSTYSSRLNVNFYASCSHREYLPVF